MKYKLYLVGPKAFVYWMGNVTPKLEEVFETPTRKYMRKSGEQLKETNCIGLSSYPEKRAS